MHIFYCIIKYNIIIYYIMKFIQYLTNIWTTVSDPKFKKIILYLFVTLMLLVLFTKPTFGYDPFNMKMLKNIGLGTNELYFYLGYILIYTILIFFAIYNRIDRCIEEYRKRDPKYQNYSARDFVSNYVSDVLYDAYKKTIGTLITPFVIFIIITFAYLVVNNLSKIAIPLKIATSIVNFGMVIIVPIINVWLFFVYFLIIDSAIAC